MEAGCHAVVWIREDPVLLARVLKRRPWNCLPGSVVNCWGHPKRATQTDTKALVTASAVVKERECLRPTDVSVDGGETVQEARRHGQRPYHERNVPTGG